MKYYQILFVICALLQSSNAFSEQKKRLSVSGKPQDEAHCALLGDTRISDNKCLKAPPGSHTDITKTKYEVHYRFGDEQAFCKSSELAKPLMEFFANQNTKYDQTYDGNCRYKFIIDTKQEICSQQMRNLDKKIMIKITKLELTKAGNWNPSGISLYNECK